MHSCYPLSSRMWHLKAPRKWVTVQSSSPKLTCFMETKSHRRVLNASGPAETNSVLCCLYISIGTLSESSPEIDYQRLSDRDSFRIAGLPGISCWKLPSTVISDCRAWWFSAKDLYLLVHFLKFIVALRDIVHIRRLKPVSVRVARM